MQYSGGYGILYTACDDLYLSGNKFFNNSDDNYYNAGSNGSILLNGNISDNAYSPGAVTAGYNNFGSGWIEGLPE